MSLHMFLLFVAYLSFGIIEDHLGPSLCSKLHSIGWVVSRIATVRSEVKHFSYHPNGRNNKLISRFA